MAWRSWGKIAAGGDQPGMDNWEHCHGGEPEALAWSIAKVAKQLQKGYTHAAGSEDVYEAAQRDAAPPPRRARAAGAPQSRL